MEEWEAIAVHILQAHNIVFDCLLSLRVEFWCMLICVWFKVCEYSSAGLYLYWYRYRYRCPYSWYRHSI